MKKSIIRIWSVARKVKFQSISPAPIVIFEKEGSNLLHSMGLFDQEVTLLPTIEDGVFLNFQIACMVATNMFKHDTGWSDQSGIWNFLRKARLMYYLSWLTMLNPKVVITFIDNSPDFCWLSRNYSNAYFIAVQNGLRLPSHNLSADLPPRPSYGSILSMTNLVCFGQYEADAYTQCGHTIDSFHKVGSLRASYFKAIIQKNIKPIIKYDICIISVYAPSFYATSQQDGIAVENMDNYFQSYLTNKNLRVCVALRNSSGGDEEEYYRAIFGREVHIIGRDVNCYSTYSAMYQSSLIISSGSTCLLEALGWRKKILYCNIGGTNLLDVVEHPLLQINSCNYNDFAARLDQLLEMPQAGYEGIINEYAQYRMNFSDEMPVHKYIQELIQKQLTQPSPAIK